MLEVYGFIFGNEVVKYCMASYAVAGVVMMLLSSAPFFFFSMMLIND